ncbi:hypothetical protein CPB97_008479 [Podila verticillata]|nr:hypothetical protein CPB97_008479 [Podila verticillata]
MHLSIFFSTLIVLAALSLAHAQLDEARAERFIAIKKRDLLGNLLPISNNSNNPPPAQPPAAAASPTDSAKPGAAGGPIPSLLNDVLNQPGGTPMTPTASAPKKPHSSSDDTTGAGAPGPTAPAPESNPPEQTSISPTLIAVVSVVLVALLVAILFSCHRIRQSRQRRHRNLDEDILKHHNGSVGYSEGGGYGMYVGKESDLWRKNLDLFHRG